MVTPGWKAWEEIREEARATLQRAADNAPDAAPGEILLHAAKGCTAEEWRRAADAIEGISGRRPPPLGQLPRGGIVGAFRVSHAVRQEHPVSHWAVPGLVHLHLERVRELPFVELAGQLGFFEVPPSVVAHLFPPPAEQMGLFGGSRG